MKKNLKTDLPEILRNEQLETTREKLREAGWETMEEGSWLQLRKAVSEPPEGWFDGLAGQEAECCRSLLNRHPEQQHEKDQRIEYSLIKAGEEGQQSYETACRRLHHDWAERLRKKRKLPQINIMFFEGGE